VIRSVTLNSLEHLGNQRFVLPPFSEHFKRWVKDVTTLLSDFEVQLPEAVNQQYKQSIEKTLSNLEGALKERMETESSISSKLSDAQRQLAKYESELSKVDHDYKTRTHEVRRRYEQSFEKLRREIDTLDGQRLRILHTKPTLIEKLFRRSEVNLEEKANALRSKKNALGDSKEALKQDLEKHRVEYENRRNQVTEQLSALRAELEESKGSKLDDALEIRKAACEELRQEVSEAVDRLLKEKYPETAEGKM
jgi:DNA repair exonuclease SbcCD ATPase subunit